ncbi:MAG: hypothetical protein ACOCXJ_07300, partial [Planctomycetota bacterium]
CDASRPRRRVLRGTLARQGVSCALVTPLHLAALTERLGAAADAVLVDAPCSGHVPRSVKQVRRMAARQEALLSQAAVLLRPGGRLVYSTCTPYPEEDEAVVAAFLARHPAFHIEPRVLLGCDPDLTGAGGLRCWPQRQGTEPFFACLLRRDGAVDQARAGLPQAITGRLPPLCDADMVPELPGLHHWRHGDLLLAAPPAVAACALPAEARGVLLGRWSGGELQLDVWGAQALIARGVPAEPVDHASACRLWAGEPLPAPAGLLQTEHGAPLGWHDGTRLRLPSRLCRSGLR